VCALQLEYSLVERNIEREHVPAALELGAGICPWSPLASGFLTGKYRRTGEGAAGEGRLATMASSGNAAFDKFTARNWAVLDVLLEVAREVGRSPAQVALQWVARRPGVSSTILGATKLEQLEDNLGALSFDLPPELSAKLEEAGRPEVVHPYLFFAPEMQARLSGDVPVRREPPWYRPS
jgi:aryl-alcohol dehydrogenase-like predicted oxidoreductase